MKPHTLQVHPYTYKGSRRQKGYVHWARGEKRLPVPDSCLTRLTSRAEKSIPLFCLLPTGLPRRPFLTLKKTSRRPSRCSESLRASSSLRFGSDHDKTGQRLCGAGSRRLSIPTVLTSGSSASREAQRCHFARISRRAGRKPGFPHSDLVRAEAALLLDEIMRTCDRLTRCEVALSPP